MPSPLGEGQTDMPINRDYLGEVHPTKDCFSSCSNFPKWSFNYFVVKYQLSPSKTHLVKIGASMEINELDIHVQKILKGLVEFYLELGYKDESYNDPERGGIYEHKLANRLGYQLTPGDFPPPEFIAAAQILEAKGFVKRMKRNDDFPILGIWPTSNGVLEYQKLVDETSRENKLMNSVDNTKVFVVHGRNDELRKSMFDFLRSIGLKPIEWSQAIQMTGETAPFIGDILDEAFQQAQAVIVLLNGEDEARLRPEYHSNKMPDYEKNSTPQARPNVIFEAGLALGRFPKRTIIVEIGDLRPFSDIAGRHTIRLDNTTKNRQDVAQRLEIAGCKVDLSGTDWHHTGNFEVTESKSWEIVINRLGKGYINAKDASGGDESGINISHKNDLLNLIDCINLVLKQNKRQAFQRYKDNISIIIMPDNKHKGLYYIEREGGNWIRLPRKDLGGFRNQLRDILYALL